MSVPGTESTAPGSRQDAAASTSSTSSTRRTCEEVRAGGGDVFVADHTMHSSGLLLEGTSAHGTEPHVMTVLGGGEAGQRGQAGEVRSFALKFMEIAGTEAKGAEHHEGLVVVDSEKVIMAKEAFASAGSTKEGQHRDGRDEAAAAVAEQEEEAGDGEEEEAELHQLSSHEGRRRGASGTAGGMRASSRSRAPSSSRGLCLRPMKRARGGATGVVDDPGRAGLVGHDRHTKVNTRRGPRDRRVRLSISAAVAFYDLQDRLGVNHPSAAMEWLLQQAAPAIQRLPRPHGTEEDEGAVPLGTRPTAAAEVRVNSRASSLPRHGAALGTSSIRVQAGLHTSGGIADFASVGAPTAAVAAAGGMGRSIAGKYSAMIATGGSHSLGFPFEDPAAGLSAQPFGVGSIFDDIVLPWEEGSAAARVATAAGGAEAGGGRADMRSRARERGRMRAAGVGVENPSQMAGQLQPEVGAQQPLLYPSYGFEGMLMETFSGPLDVSPDLHPLSEMPASFLHMEQTEDLAHSTAAAAAGDAASYRELQMEQRSAAAAAGGLGFAIRERLNEVAEAAYGRGLASGLPAYAPPIQPIHSLAATAGQMLVTSAQEVAPAPPAAPVPVAAAAAAAATAASTSSRSSPSTSAPLSTSSACAGGATSAGIATPSRQGTQFYHERYRRFASPAIDRSPIATEGGAAAGAGGSPWGTREGRVAWEATRREATEAAVAATSMQERDEPPYLAADRYIPYTYPYSRTHLYHPPRFGMVYPPISAFPPYYSPSPIYSPAYHTPSATPYPASLYLQGNNEEGRERVAPGQAVQLGRLDSVRVDLSSAYHAQQTRSRGSTAPMEGTGESDGHEGTRG